MREEIVDVYNFIYNLAYNMLACHHSAQDITQSIYIQFNKKLEQNPEMDEGYKRFWIIRSTKNKCFNYIRDNKRLCITAPEDFGKFVDYSPDPSQVLEQNQEKDLLYQNLKNNINSLTDMQKQILHLRFQEDLSYKEIKNITGFSETKSKTLLHRAIKCLRSKMVKPAKLNYV